ncbi:hypothetical protein SAICODRAFT_188045 [Saitoella complicata NRRL Y-17804]|uniref:uncharacterized protein n=1 Tax=Saitoella complicata (strain BCRC 22490 / CBS 7301 / JCM 7358 / NBRC 10748 / NRRL Y-17804) TaxID=698492 RepID=UPI0008679F4E|nr:uncharacterized protein SAICODRAFT_188045 [Saitoella complicata NRRL Y-17804]ODQ49879.1 hypothetical protein SAICODRAFT_188045 [Saitoella complicata NRRL Y-17804]
MQSSVLYRILKPSILCARLARLCGFKNTILRCSPNIAGDCVTCGYRTILTITEEIYQLWTHPFCLVTKFRQCSHAKSVLIPTLRSSKTRFSCESSAPSYSGPHGLSGLIPVTAILAILLDMVIQTKVTVMFVLIVRKRAKPSTT